MRTNYELVVIGGGAAGLGAARAAVARGASTLLVSDGPPGGYCTFTGCVPSKTLIECAAQGVPFDVAMRRVKDTVAAIAATEDADALAREGIEVVSGRAGFVDTSGAEQRIEVDGRVCSARRVVIATGSKPTTPELPACTTRAS